MHTNLKGKSTLFEKTHFPLSHGQIRANPKGKNQSKSKKIYSVQKALKSAQVRTKWQTKIGTMKLFRTKCFWDNGFI